MRSAFLRATGGFLGLLFPTLRLLWEKLYKWKSHFCLCVAPRPSRRETAKPLRQRGPSLWPPLPLGLRVPTAEPFWCSSPAFVLEDLCHHLVLCSFLPLVRTRGRCCCVGCTSAPLCPYTQPWAANRRLQRDPLSPFLKLCTEDHLGVGFDAELMFHHCSFSTCRDGQELTPLCVQPVAANRRWLAPGADLPAYLQFSLNPSCTNLSCVILILWGCLRRWFCRRWSSEQARVWLRDEDPTLFVADVFK